MRFELQYVSKMPLSSFLDLEVLFVAYFMGICWLSLLWDCQMQGVFFLFVRVWDLNSGKTIKPRIIKPSPRRSKIIYNFFDMLYFDVRHVTHE